MAQDTSLGCARNPLLKESSWVQVHDPARFWSLDNIWDLAVRSGEGA